MSAVLSFLAPFWKEIAGALAGLVAIAAVYLKGRGDAKAKARLEDVTDANDIRKAGADARDSVSRDGLRDDGWRRD
jgi:hypothetical protein